MFLELTGRRERLQARAEMLRQARAFFAEREIMEVDVPILSKAASIDAHIDLIEASAAGKRYFLHSSPEYGMKRLLSEGIGDIYQLSHVFREEEVGHRHNPEFTMAEWYRVGFSLKEMIEETLDFVALFLPQKPEGYEEMSYRELFLRYLGYFPESQEERDLQFCSLIEPQIGRAQPTVINGFPKERAALAQMNQEGVAERFEIFLQGMELANGYHELLDAKEQRRRLIAANAERIKLGKGDYPMDHNFLAALERGVEDCCGVAVGFDRLMMLKEGATSIQEVIPFSWEQA
jgi:elongation factor P--(R)-beta-lysine ligase